MPYIYIYLVHAFNHDAMLTRRIEYAEKLGITIDEYLLKESFEDEKNTILKNCKKKKLTTMDLILPTENVQI